MIAEGSRCSRFDLASHDFVHMIAFGGWKRHGMAVKSDDLSTPSDGAVVVPFDKVEEMMKAMEKLTAHEAKIIEAARSPEMTLEKLKAAIGG